MNSNHFVLNPKAYSLVCNNNQMSQADWFDKRTPRQFLLPTLLPQLSAINYCSLLNSFLKTQEVVKIPSIFQERLLYYHSLLSSIASHFPILWVCSSRKSNIIPDRQRNTCSATIQLYTYLNFMHFLETLTQLICMIVTVGIKIHKMTGCCIIVPREFFFTILYLKKDN